MFNDRFGLTQAVLEGRKTMTRRICSDKELRKLKQSKSFFCKTCSDDEYITKHLSQHQYSLVSKYAIHEEVAVAQSYNDIWNTQEEDFRIKIGMQDEYSGFIYTKFIENGGWNNKMFVCAEAMPSRIRINNIRVERLQDISDEDCLKEGIRPYNGSMIPQDTVRYVGSSIDIIPPYGFDDYKLRIFHNYYTPKEAYSELIGRIEGKGTWKSNPFVFVYEFELVK